MVRPDTITAETFPRGRRKTREMIGCTLTPDRPVFRAVPARSWPGRPYSIAFLGDGNPRGARALGRIDCWREAGAADLVDLSRAREFPAWRFSRDRSRKAACAGTRVRRDTILFPGTFGASRALRFFLDQAASRRLCNHVDTRRP